jgi:DnaJ-class molecular chaperone
MDKGMNHYEILNVSRTASLKDIKTAYYFMARTHHPDKGGSLELMQKINLAYECLRDTNERYQYNLLLTAKEKCAIPSHFPVPVI